MTAKEKKEYLEYLKEKNSKEIKPLYKVDFFEDGRDSEPVATRHIHAFSVKQAKELLKGRAAEEARRGQYLLTYLLGRDDVMLVIKKVEDTRSIAKTEREKMKSLHTCQQCGEILDDDYCQSCGWRKQSWVDRAMAKQG